MSGAVWLILAKDLKKNLRNGFFLVMGIVTPLVLALVFGLVFGGTSSGRLEIPVGYVDADQSELSAGLGVLLDRLDGEGLLEVTQLEGGARPATALEDRDLAAVVVVPDGFGAAATGPGATGATGGPATGTAGELPSIEIVAADEAPTSVGIVASVVEQFARDSDRARIGAATAAALGLAPPPPPAQPAVSVVDRDAATRLDPATQMSAAMASLFLFIIALLGVTSILDERRDGTLARLLAAPIPRSSVIVAKILVSVVLGVISVTALIVAVGVVLDADWGAPVGVAALVVTFSVTAAALTLLVAGSAPTAEAAGSRQSILAVLLASLGGAWYPCPTAASWGC